MLHLVVPRDRLPVRDVGHQALALQRAALLLALVAHQLKVERQHDRAAVGELGLGERRDERVGPADRRDAEKLDAAARQRRPDDLEHQVDRHVGELFGDHGAGRRLGAGAAQLLFVGRIGVALVARALLRDEAERLVLVERVDAAAKLGRRREDLDVLVDHEQQHLRGALVVRVDQHVVADLVRLARRHCHDLARDEHRDRDGLAEASRRREQALGAQLGERVLAQQAHQVLLQLGAVVLLEREHEHRLVHHALLLRPALLRDLRVEVGERLAHPPHAAVALTLDRVGVGEQRVLPLLVHTVAPRAALGHLDVAAHQVAHERLHRQHARLPAALRALLPLLLCGVGTAQLAAECAHFAALGVRGERLVERALGGAAVGARALGVERRRPVGAWVAAGACRAREAGGGGGRVLACRRRPRRPAERHAKAVGVSHRLSVAGRRALAVKADEVGGDGALLRRRVERRRRHDAVCRDAPVLLRRQIGWCGVFKIAKVFLLRRYACRS